VVIESDDWGSVRTRDRESRKALTARFPESMKDAFNRLDSLESNEDLEALLGVLDAFRDRNGHAPVLTVNYVAGNPDFSAIASNGYTAYVHEPFTETLKRYPGRDRVNGLIRQGMDTGIYRPQLHGREHVQVNHWMDRLRNRDPEVIMAFEYEMFGLNLTRQASGRQNLMAALDMRTRADLTGQERLLGEAQHIFASEFGYRSESFIAPAYVWHPGIHRHLYQLGVRYMQGLAFQFIPDANSQGYRKRSRYTGKKDTSGLIHLVRNAFFEPSISGKTDEAERCLARISEAFRFRRPAVIGSHRVNFIGSLEEGNRSENLKQFRHLLSSILKRWPGVEFMSTDQLGRLIQP